MKFVLTMNEEQARVTIAALDVYMRLRIGQWEELTELCMKMEAGHIQEYCETRDAANVILKGLREIVMPDCPRGGSYGVYHFYDTERAFNVLKAIRSARAWHNNPGGGITADYDRPHAHNVAEEMPVCEVKDV